MAVRFAIDAIFKGIDKFSAPVAKMTTRMDRFTRRVRKGMWGIGKMTKRVARNMRNLSLTMGSLVVLGGYALKGLLEPATRFQHAMDGVNAVVLGQYTEHMPKLRKEALRLGKSTTFTATQVANAMEVLAKSGLEADETLALIEPTLKGAEAAGSDISTMADILVSTIAQMKSLTPADGTTVIDAYAVAASSANTTLEELGDGMKKVIPIGERLNFGFKDMLATTTLLQHMGIEASMSASQQRTFFTRLTNLTPKAAKSFQDMGIEILDANKNMKQIPALLAAIAAGFAKVKGNAPQVRKMAEAVGLRGGIAGNILTGNIDQLEGLLLKINTLSEGAADKMAEMRLNNLFGDLVRLKSAWEFFRIEMASDTLPELRTLVQSITEFLGKKENIDVAAEKLNDAIKGLRGFWNENGDHMKALAGTTLQAAEVLLKIVVILGDALGWAFDLGDKIDEQAKRMNDSPMGEWFNRQLGLSPENSSTYNEQRYRTYGHLGVPYAETKQNVSGVISVIAAEGTAAKVEQYDGGDISLQNASGDFGLAP